MTTKQLIKDVSDISDIVTNIETDIHTYMNDIGHMVKENSNKIDNIDISCDCNREIRNLTDILEKETTDISNDITNLKDNIEDWIDDSRTILQESFSNELDKIHDAIDTIAQEQDKLSKDIDNLNMEYWVDDMRGDIKSCAQSIESIGQEQDNLKDELKDIREKLGEILTLLYESRK